MEDPQRQKRKTRVAMLSVGSNTALVILKLAVGLTIGSVSIISEAIHSAVDLLAAVIALIAVRESGKPADQRHKFGHGKVENLSGAIEALLIFAAAGWIIWEAVHKLLDPHPLENVGWGVAVMLVSAGANLFVSSRLFKVGRETDSIALQADGWHLRTDVYTSAGVMTGLLIIWVGGRLFPGVNLDWIDPLAAIAVAFLIMKAAYDLTLSATHDLLDVSLPQEEQWILERARTYAPQVHGLHDLRTRKSGHVRFVEFHLLVAPDMTVEASHDLAERLTSDIEAEYPSSSVTVHVEPCDGSCEPHCVEGCFVEEEERLSLHDASPV